MQINNKPFLYWLTEIKKYYVKIIFLTKKWTYLIKIKLNAEFSLFLNGDFLLFFILESGKC